ncbi:TPA: hypothetical protein L8O79_001759 [Klebsiella pneumoniae]|nr:hypothetical protein [Klebsiella pneumoniae]
MGLDIGQLSPWVVGAYLVPLLAGLAWIVVGAFKDGELPMMPGLLAIMLMGFGMFAVYEPKPDEWETFKAAHNCKKDVARGAETPRLAALLVQKYGKGVVDALAVVFDSARSADPVMAVVDEEVSRIDPLWQEHNRERWAGRPADVVAN